MAARKAPLRGSVNQSTPSVRLRAQAAQGVGFLTRLGIVTAAVILLVGLAIFAWDRGWPQKQAHNATEAVIATTQKAHFAVGDIQVEGRHHATGLEIIDALGVAQGSPILDFSPAQAAQRLSRLPWVDHATVERRLPNTIRVVLTEKTPMARWQHDSQTVVIDGNGQTIDGAVATEFAALPLIVGDGADKAAAPFIALLKSMPDVAARVWVIRRVGDRRWDLYLTPKILVKLPEDDVPSALHRLSVLMSQNKILERDTAAIDLRIPDRLIIEPASAPAPPPGAKPAKPGKSTGQTL